MCLLSSDPWPLSKGVFLPLDDKQRWPGHPQTDQKNTGSLHMPLFIILRAEEIRDVSPLSRFGTVPNACLCQCGGTGSVAVTVTFRHMTQASLCNLVAHLSQDISEMEIETHRENLYLNEERKFPCLQLMKLP